MASSVLPPSSELLKQEILMLLRGTLEAILASIHKMRYIQTAFGKVIKSLSKMIYLVLCIYLYRMGELPSIMQHGKVIMKWSVFLLRLMQI